MDRRVMIPARTGKAISGYSRIFTIENLKTNTMNPNKALWEKGDFTKIAETMRESGAALVGKLRISPDWEVLDLGCGDGTTAIPEAKTGARVTGIDIAANLVAAGNQRAKAEGLANCTFMEGDASNLSACPDQRFDRVISIFGAMFAPKPADVAQEMVRVTRNGGKIIMGNWIPGDPTLVAQILKISAAYTPPPPEGFVSPMLWGVEAQVVERFTIAGIDPEKMSFSRETFTFSSLHPPRELLQRFKQFYGPTMNAFEAAEKTGKAAQLEEELTALFENQNQSGSRETTSIPATFLLVTVSR